MIDNSFIILAKPNTGDYYEGNRAFLRAIYPRPTVSPVRLTEYPQSEIVFREDSYDPTTRVRRGRFYQKTGQLNIQTDRVSYLPFPRPIELVGSVFDFQNVFEQMDNLNSTLRSKEDYDVLIGFNQAETRWRIIDAEALSDGTTLFTLKSFSSFGLLPILKSDVPEIRGAYEKVVEAVKYAPVSIVDVCRESAYVILAEKFGSAKDLGDLIKNIENTATEKDNVMVPSAAKIINRLHPRGKAAEQTRQSRAGKPLRSVVDDDAILAIRLFGFLLTEMTLAVP
jgi:hypothetical protein